MLQLHTTISIFLARYHAAKNEENFFLSFCGGPLFVGAPVRANMLNMRESASAVHSLAMQVRFTASPLVQVRALTPDSQQAGTTELSILWSELSLSLIICAMLSNVKLQYLT